MQSVGCQLIFRIYENTTHSALFIHVAKFVNLLGVTTMIVTEYDGIHDTNFVSKLHSGVFLALVRLDLVAVSRYQSIKGQN